MFTPKIQEKYDKIKNKLSMKRASLREIEWFLKKVKEIERRVEG